MTKYVCGSADCDFSVESKRIETFRRARRRHRAETGHDSLAPIITEDSIDLRQDDRARLTHRCIIPGCDFRIEARDDRAALAAIQRHQREMVGHTRLVPIDWRMSTGISMLIHALRVGRRLQNSGPKWDGFDRRTIDAARKIGLVNERVVIGGNGRRIMTLTELGRFVAMRQHKRTRP